MTREEFNKKVQRIFGIAIVEIDKEVFDGYRYVRQLYELQSLLDKVKSERGEAE